MGDAVGLATYLSKEFSISQTALTGDHVPLVFTKYINDTKILGVNPMPQVPTSPNMDESYLEFIDSLISTLTRDKSGNVLAYGYVDAAASGSSNAAVSGHVNFNANIIKLALWHHIHDLIGRSAFVKMIYTVRAYGLRTDGNYYQIFGPGVRFRSSALPSKRASFAVSRTTHRSKLRGDSILNKNVDEIVGMIIAEPNSSRKAVKAFSGLKKLLALAIERDKRNNYECIYASIVRTDKVERGSSVGLPTPPGVVLRMVLVIVSLVFPLSVWGSKRNKAVVCDAISQLVFRRSPERIPLSTLCEKVKITDISWLGKSKHPTSKQDFESRCRRLLLFLTWFLNFIVNRTISKFWYVVEAGCDDQSLIHYPHRQWKRATGPWLDTYVDKYLIPCDMTMEKVSEPSSFYNFGWMRLLPKKDDFRMLCVPSKIPWLEIGQPRNDNYLKHYKSYDSSQVKPIREIIDAQSREKRELTRASYPICYSTRDVAEQVSLFKARMFRKHGPKVVFHMIKFDMKHCYDQLNQMKIIGCVDNLLSATETNPVFHSRTIWDCTDEIERIKKSKTIIFDQENVERFENATMSTGTTRAKIYVDSGKNKRFTKDAIMQFVRKQLSESFCLVRGARFAYKRRVGVFQGFPLLSCFCDVVYNQMVLEQFPFVLAEPAQAILLRLVDDFLVISIREDIVSRTLDVVRGTKLHQYGAYANDSKTMVSESAAPVIIPFAGLDINTASLAVWRTYVHGSVKFPNAVASFKQLFDYLVSRFRFCLDDTSIDTTLNTSTVVYENVERLLRAVLEAFASKYSFLVKAGNEMDCEQFKVFLLELLCVTLERIRRVNGECHQCHNKVTAVFRDILEKTLPRGFFFYNEIVTCLLEWIK